MKKKLRVLLAVVLAAVLAAGGFAIGASSGLNINVTYDDALVDFFGGNGGSASADAPAQTTAPSTTAATTESTTASTTAGTTAGSTVASTEGTNAGTTAATTAATTQAASSIPTAKEDIVAAYCKAVNATKKESNLTVRRVEDVEVAVTDCSVSFLRGMVDGIVQGLIKDSDKTYVFTNGQGVKTDDPNDTRPLDDFIAPYNRECNLTPEFVADAKSTDLGGGAYELEIKLISEDSSFKLGGDKVDPAGHKAIMDPLNLGDIKADPAKITEANMTYPGATLKAKVNANGTLDELYLECPLSGDGTGEIASKGLTVKLEGGITDTWTFTR